MPRLEPDARRFAILTAATDLFLQHGYAATSLGMIIQQSGGSRRSIYEHFGDKAALFKAAMDLLFAQAPQAFSLLDRTDGPKVVLNQIGVALLSRLLEPSDVGRMGRKLLADAINFPEIGQLLLETGPNQIRAALADYFDQMTQNGILVMADPTAAARIFLQMVTGNYHLQSLIDPGFLLSADEVRAHVASAVDIFLHGVAAK